MTKGLHGGHKDAEEGGYFPSKEVGRPLAGQEYYDQLFRDLVASRRVSAEEAEQARTSLEDNGRFEDYYWLCMGGMPHADALKGASYKDFYPLVQHGISPEEAMRIVQREDYSSLPDETVEAVS
ncbi:MAG TPA: hypothetical protein VIL71_01070 [Spirillospora sp.]